MFEKNVCKKILFQIIIVQNKSAYFDQPPISLRALPKLNFFYNLSKPWLSICVLNALLAGNELTAFFKSATNCLPCVQIWKVYKVEPSNMHKQSTQHLLSCHITYLALYTSVRLTIDSRQTLLIIWSRSFMHFPQFV